MNEINKVCPLKICQETGICHTRTLVVCDFHEDGPKLFCPVKNRGLECPLCGKPTRKRVSVINKFPVDNS